jgi:hypothetical protein
MTQSINSVGDAPDPNYEKQKEIYEDVYKFLNSTRLKTPDDIFIFLRVKGYPLKLEWLFYGLAKIDYFQDRRNYAPENTGTYKGHYFTETYYWEYLIKGERLKPISKRNKRRFDEYSIEMNKRIWKDVTQLSHESLFPEDDNFFYVSDDNSFCDACQQSPCMCSDPERTSTTYDR